MNTQAIENLKQLLEIQKNEARKELIQQILALPEMEHEVPTIEMFNYEVLRIDTRNRFRSQLRHAISKLMRSAPMSGGVKSGKWEVEKQRRANIVNV